MGRTKLDRSARKKGSHLPEDMKAAVNLHLSGMSLRKAAKNSKIPYPTLRRYVMKYLKDQCAAMEPNYSVNKIFSEVQETSLKEYIVDCANKFYGLSTKECRRLALQMAEINKLEYPTSWKENGMAGKDWLRGFKKRHPDLCIKKPEACSIARATAFNRTNVKKFFDNLRNVSQRFPQFGDGTRVYNLDETSTSTVQRPGKVIAQKGQNISKVTSGERGILVTTCCIVNATGHALPPVMVFPRKKYVPHMISGAPTGTLGLATKTGWMNSDLFIDVMKHFVKFTASSKDNPSLLIMDNHESHLSLGALDIAKESGVTILTLHPHTTSKLQPLDVGLNGPFKTYYNAAVDSWLLRNPGRSCSIYNVAECVGTAYLKAMTPINITQAFKKCGIFPFNCDIFSEVDFLPSNVTDRPELVTNERRPSDADATSMSDVSEMYEAKHDLIESRSFSPSLLFNSDQRNNEPGNLISLSLEVIASSTKKDLTGFENAPTTSLASSANPEAIKKLAVCKNASSSLVLTTNSKDLSKLKNVSLSEVKFTEPLHALQSSVNSKLTSDKYTAPGRKRPPSKPLTENLISPKQFRPDLKVGQRKNRQGGRKTGRSMIATDTPEKNALAEKKHNKALEKKKLDDVNKVKQKLFKQKENKQRKKKVPPSSSESSDKDEEEFHPSGSSSGGEVFEMGTDWDEEEIVLRDDFPPLQRSPRINDFVIILFKSKKDKIYYVAKILEFLDDDEECDFYVSYLKLKSKILQKFIEPKEPDTAGVNIDDIKFILPFPKIEGNNSRRQTTYKFPVDISLLNLRY